MKTRHLLLALIESGVELYLTAELVWYIVHDGDERLYEYIIEQVPEIRHRIAHRIQIHRTLRHIRRLPEQ